MGQCSRLADGHPRGVGGSYHPKIRAFKLETVAIIQLEDQSGLESCSGCGYKDKGKMHSVNSYAHKTLRKEMESRMTSRFSSVRTWVNGRWFIKTGNTREVDYEEETQRCSYKKQVKRLASQQNKNFFHYDRKELGSCIKFTGAIKHVAEVVSIWGLLSFSPTVEL